MPTPRASAGCSAGRQSVSSIIATEVWDFGAGRASAQRQVQLARDRGALLQLQFALNVLASSELLAGDFASAAAHIQEDRLVAEATGINPSPTPACCWRRCGARRSRRWP